MKRAKITRNQFRALRKRVLAPEEGQRLAEAKMKAKQEVKMKAMQLLAPRPSRLIFDRF